MGVNATLNAARLGLAASQFAIDVTSSNVTNVNTPGYVRQRPDFQADGAIDVGAKSFQVGVDIPQIQRIYDRYLESQIVDSKMEVGYSTTARDYLQRVEGLFNEANGGGINDLLGKFWASWQDLNGNPQGSAERTVVLSAAEDLAARFREFSGDLTSVAMDAREEIGATVTDINSDIEKIAELNGEIMAQGKDNGDANLLLDERAKLLTSVAEKIGINYIEDSGGNIDIYLTDGNSLVYGGSARQLEMVGDDIRIKGTTELVTAGITKGKLGAMLDVRDRLVPGYLDSLNTLAEGIVNAVNDQHTKGYTANGEVAGNFFAPVGAQATAARNMTVSTEISANPGMIAASATVDGDGDNARTIGALSNLLTMLPDDSHQTIYGSRSFTVDAGGVDTGNPITAATALNDLYGLTNFGVDDKIFINGTLRNGQTLAPKSYSYADGGTVGDLLTAIQGAFDGDVTATVNASGQIILTDNQAGGVSLISLSLADSPLNTWGTFSGNSAAASTMNGYYGALTAQVGQDVSTAISSKDHRDIIMNQLDEKWQSASGVSIDEEMMNLIKYQMGYNAAGRLVTVANELMDTLINLGK